MKSTAGYGVYVKMLSDYMEREVNRSLCSLELTFSQHKVLMLLTHRPDHTSALKAVESEFHAAQSTVAGLAARLEKKGTGCFPSGRERSQDQVHPYHPRGSGAVRKSKAAHHRG